MTKTQADTPTASFLACVRVSVHVGGEPGVLLYSCTVPFPGRVFLCAVRAGLHLHAPPSTHTPSAPVAVPWWADELPTPPALVTDEVPSLTQRFVIRLVRWLVRGDRGGDSSLLASREYRRDDNEQAAEYLCLRTTLAAIALDVDVDEEEEEEEEVTNPAYRLRRRSS